jgi:hypothetical protein
MQAEGWATLNAFFRDDIFLQQKALQNAKNQQDTNEINKIILEDRVGVLDSAMWFTVWSFIKVAEIAKLRQMIDSSTFPDPVKKRLKQRIPQ